MNWNILRIQINSRLAWRWPSSKEIFIQRNATSSNKSSLKKKNLIAPSYEIQNSLKTRPRQTVAFRAKILSYLCKSTELASRNQVKTTGATHLKSFNWINILSYCFAMSIDLNVDVGDGGEAEASSRYKSLVGWILVQVLKLQFDFCKAKVWPKIYLWNL